MLGLPSLSYFLLYIVSIPKHNIDDHMETSNRKDRLNRLRLRSDDRDDSYDRDDHMETRLKLSLPLSTSVVLLPVCLEWLVLTFEQPRKLKFSTT